MTTQQDSAALRLQTEKLNSASEYVSSNWLPINSKLIEEINRRLDADYYSGSGDSLLEDLKSDIGLLIYCIKEAGQTKASSIYQKLKSLEKHELKNILQKCRMTCRQHSLLNSSTEQLNQLTSVITSSAVCETMASGKKADSEIAFISAVFRQLGLTFIAWNYPNVFKNCLASSANEEELTDNINRALGFCPSLLGLRLAKEWQVPSRVIRIIGGDQSNPEVERLEEDDFIIKLCKIGELLASLNNDNYPLKPEGAWNHARNEILKNLGSKGLKLIDENIQKLSKHYATFIPSMANSSVSKKIEEVTKPSSSASLFHSNAYVQFLSPEVQEEMRLFYQLITPEGLSKESVAFLHGRLIPIMGFTEGCLYLIDPASHALQPRLSFGTKKISDFKSLNLTAHENSGHPLLKAFNAHNPVVRAEDESSEIKYICGAVGSVQRSGVLCLELSQALKNNNKINPTLYFRALIRALEDCLGLR